MALPVASSSPLKMAFLFFAHLLLFPPVRGYKPPLTKIMDLTSSSASGAPWSNNTSTPTVYAPLDESPSPTFPDSILPGNDTSQRNFNTVLYTGGLTEGIICYTATWSSQDLDTTDYLTHTTLPWWLIFGERPKDKQAQSPVTWPEFVYCIPRDNHTPFINHNSRFPGHTFTVSGTVSVATEGNYGPEVEEKYYVDNEEYYALDVVWWRKDVETMPGCRVSSSTPMPTGFVPTATGISYPFSVDTSYRPISFRPYNPCPTIRIPNRTWRPRKKPLTRKSGYERCYGTLPSSFWVYPFKKDASLSQVSFASPTPCLKYERECTQLFDLENGVLVGDAIWTGDRNGVHGWDEQDCMDQEVDFCHLVLHHDPWGKVRPTLGKWEACHSVDEKGSSDDELLLHIDGDDEFWMCDGIMGHHFGQPISREEHTGITDRDIGVGCAKTKLVVLPDFRGRRLL